MYCSWGVFSRSGKLARRHVETRVTITGAERVAGRTGRLVAGDRAGKVGRGVWRGRGGWRGLRTRGDSRLGHGRFGDRDVGALADGIATITSNPNTSDAAA